ncbi:transferrin-binding protein-like solute binding protein [Brevundimonas sp.]|uniref:transferrin-binding protein-like solute binding protein n=1 Tax=Brevundimonas sp. TaxID=1871086 RepID=UPI00272F49FA|nr:transferrin-binding protein-like solute binding protein [Brevundimonas sp.]MDP1913789.1 transferrin-binding protein-like solute binding protein [Brevundimonas sp.]
MRVDANGPMAIISTNGSIGGIGYEAVLIERGERSRVDDDSYVFWSAAGATLMNRRYVNFAESSDGLGRIRTGTNTSTDTDIFGNIIPGSDGTTLTLFDITNVLQGGLDYVQLGRVSNGVSNGVQTYFAVGDPTPSPVMPTTGSARYAGGTRGTYLTAAGVSYQTASDITMNANFGTGQITGSTTNLRMIDSNGAAATTPAGLNFNFTANIAGAAFNGTASSPSMTGSVDGRFYGEPGGAPVEAGLSYSLGAAAGGGRLVGVGGLKRE